MYLQQDLDVPTYDEFKNEIEQRFQQAQSKISKPLSPPKTNYKMQF